MSTKNRTDHPFNQFRFCGTENAIWIIALLLGVLGLVLHLSTPLNHDAAWHFQTSFRALAGDRVGYEVFDINPPMSMWMYMLPALFVNYIWGAPEVVFSLFVFLALLILLVTSLFMFRKLGLGNADMTMMAVVILAGAIILPGYDFAQREHLTAFLVLPYVLATLARAKFLAVGVALSVWVAFLAGLGIGVKPYFVCVPILLECWLMANKRNPFSWLRTEALVLISLLAVYVFMVWVLTPGYFTIVLPDALSNYSGFSTTFGDFFLASLKILVPTLACLVLSFLACRTSFKNLYVQVFYVAAAGFFLAALMQKKAWSYQLYPVSFYLILAAGYLLIRTSGKTHYPFFRNAAVACMIIAVVMPSFRYVVESTSQNGTSERVGRLSSLFGEGQDSTKTVFAFITSPRDVHPAVMRSGAYWAGNSGVQVYLPASLSATDKTEANARLHEIARRHDLQTIARLLVAQPDLLLFQTGPGRLAIHDDAFSYLTHYSSYPQFAKLMEAYCEQERLYSYRVFSACK